MAPPKVVKPGEWLKNETDHATAAPKQDLGDTSKCDSRKVEVWLQKFNVKYSSLLSLPLANIDERQSRANQARPTALIEDSVNSYAAAMRTGDVFPPVVGYRSGAKVVLIDGNNRDGAARKVGAETLFAYVLHPDTPGEVIRAMTVDANAHHPVRPTVDWRVEQANSLMGLGYSAVQASAYAAVSVKQIQDGQRITNAERRAKELRVPNFTRLPATTKLSLGSLRGDPVFLQAASVAISTEMTLEETRKLVRDIKARANESEQVVLIGEYAAERKMAKKAQDAMGRGRPVKSEKMSLITGIGKILHADPALVARQVVTDVERWELIHRGEDAVDRLAELDVALRHALVEARDVG